MDTLNKEEELQSALLLYQNLQITTTELINKMSSNHQDRVNLAVVLKSILSDISYEPGKIKNKNAAKLYQLAHVILKSKEVIKVDLRNKLVSGETEVSEDTKNKILKEM